MIISRYFGFRLVAVLTLTLVLAGSAFGFANSNTMPEATKAGDGAKAISGYTVSNVQYNLNTADPTKIASFEFDLDASARTVKAQLSDATAAAWYECSQGTGNHWSCSTGATALTQPSVSSANNLRVVAVQ